MVKNKIVKFIIELYVGFIPSVMFLWFMSGIFYQKRWYMSVLYFFLMIASGCILFGINEYAEIISYFEDLDESEKKKIEKEIEKRKIERAKKKK